MVEFLVTCTRCEYEETVSETTGGQTLGGTAGDKAARHESLCGNQVRINVIDDFPDVTEHIRPRKSRGSVPQRTVPGMSVHPLNPFYKNWE